MKAALRDTTFYACPSGHGHNPRTPKYHAIVERPTVGFPGPACGIPFYNEGTEMEAGDVPASLWCGKPGCRKAFTTAQQAAR